MRIDFAHGLNASVQFLMNVNVCLNEDRKLDRFLCHKLFENILQGSVINTAVSLLIIMKCCFLKIKN